MGDAVRYSREMYEITVTKNPALSLPAGHYPSGVPFGLQITGPRFGDDLLLDIAAAWEEAHPWHLAAEGYDPFGV